MMETRTRLSAFCGTICLMAITAWSVICQGCIFASTSYYPLAFSPDSGTFVFSKRDQTDIAILAPESMTISQAIAICWCPSSQVDNVRCVDVDSVGKDYDGYSLFARLKCSPKTEYLAVETRGKLVCIDLATAKRWPLSQAGEIVTSFEWISDNQIGYVAHTNIREETLSDRSVWRQSVRPPTERERVHEEQDTESSIIGLGRVSREQFEYWSPRGNYVVFKVPMFGGPFTLLDVRDGSMRPLSEPVRSAVDVAWKPDESALVLVSRILRPPDGQPFRAEIHELPSRQVHDFSEPFNTSFGTTDIMSFGWTLARYLPDWTADGQYLIINHLDAGGCLVRPRPWEVKRVGEELDQLHPSPHASDLSADREESGLAPIRFLPDIASHAHPGWVWAAGQDGILYAVNYENSRTVPVGEMGGFRFPSPDGKLLASLDHKGVVRIKTLDLAGISKNSSETHHRKP